MVYNFDMESGKLSKSEEGTVVVYPTDTPESVIERETSIIKKEE